MLLLIEIMILCVYVLFIAPKDEDVGSTVGAIVGGSFAGGFLLATAGYLGRRYHRKRKSHREIEQNHAELKEQNQEHQQGAKLPSI